jgi:hypothetical protein
MERQLMVTVPNVSGEDGLTVACREGRLFRNDEQLENLYKEGFRIYNYDVVKDKKTRNPLQTLVKVFLKK